MSLLQNDSTEERMMTITDWLVLIGGIVAILWVNWYFFFAEASAKEERK